jgi:hypothetical protein
MSAPSQTYKNIMDSKPLLLDPKYNIFPEDIVIKINNYVCEEYLKIIYQSLETNFIKNIINIFLNNKNLSKFIYYFGYHQTNSFNRNNTSLLNLSVFGENLNNLKIRWNNSNIDKDEPYILNMCCNYYIFNTRNRYGLTPYKYDAHIYSSKLTETETQWIVKNHSMYNENILQDSSDIDVDIDIDIEDNMYDDIYDYDNEEYANIWNLFNRAFMGFNVFKIIKIFCDNLELDNTIKQYYDLIGGKEHYNFNVDYTKLFHKTCYNVIKYFNKKIKKTVDDHFVIKYLYSIYSEDINMYFIEEHQQYKDKATDLLLNNGRLNSTEFNILKMLDLLYELYLK